MFEITTQSINQLLISHHRTCQKQDRIDQFKGRPG